MASYHGFELLRERSIAELQTEARLFRHMKTGAELLSLTNDDENKVFGIVFRTPPEDSTGVAHILEHSVLCGSRKYPVKEPFVELMKGSLKTFLNAFTYPDKTCYPVASQNIQDFYNLIDVYLDAVFYPRISSHIFQQEGWHFELESPGGQLSYKGVVFSEMKGVYSSPDSILAEKSQQSLFPDVTYGLDSGGDPKVIPTLTYEAFKSFHETYYHPSNARIFFYGNDDPERRLQLIEGYLNDFEPKVINSIIPLQSKFKDPKRIEHCFASSRSDSERKDGDSKGMVTLNWLLTDVMDTELNLSFQVLEYILLGMPGSPLRKALIDSGLGEDLAGVGLESELRQLFFSAGLKGIDIKNAERVESLILQTLAALVKEGIDPSTVEAAVNTIEFRLRENNTGSFPRGIALMLRALTTWLHGADPLQPLSFEESLNALKTHLASSRSLFENMIESYFLQNPHRTTLVLMPDPELLTRDEAAERETLDGVRNGKGLSELQSIVENTQDLRRMQSTPDSPEALASIPSLKIGDLEKRNKIIPLVCMENSGINILYHDIFTSGIAYLDVTFDLHLLPQKYLPFVPLFSRALLEMGTEREDYVKLAQRISRKTGGIHPELFTSAIRDRQEGLTRLVLRSKSMLDQTGEMLDILKDVLLEAKLDNRERFRQIVMEEKARQEQKLVPAGHQVVGLRLRSHFSEADWAAEQMGGVSYVFFLRELARLADDDWHSVLAALESIRKILVNRGAIVANITVEEKHRASIESQLIGILDSIHFELPHRVSWAPEYPPECEGMIIPAQVNYVGKGANLYGLGYRFHGSALVIAGYLRNTWLWEKVRVQGGAYGASCGFDRQSGALSFVSYRDPNLISTLESYDKCSEFLRKAPLSDNELTKAIIGTIGNVDSYLLPDAKGYISMMRYLTADTDESRQQMREEILGTTISDFRAFADVLEEIKDKGIVKILGSQNAVAGACSNRQDWLTLVDLF